MFIIVKKRCRKINTRRNEYVDIESPFTSLKLKHDIFSMIATYLVMDFLLLKSKTYFTCNRKLKTKKNWRSLGGGRELRKS